MPRGRRRNHGHHSKSMPLADFQATLEHAEAIETLVDHTALDTTANAQAAKRTQLEMQETAARRNIQTLVDAERENIHARQKQQLIADEINPRITLEEAHKAQRAEMFSEFKRTARHLAATNPARTPAERQQALREKRQEAAEAAQAAWTRNSTLSTFFPSRKKPDTTPATESTHSVPKPR